MANMLIEYQKYLKDNVSSLIRPFLYYTAPVLTH